MRGESGGEWTHVYLCLSPSVVHLKLSTKYLSALVQCKIKSEKNKDTFSRRPRKSEWVTDPKPQNQLDTEQGWALGFSIFSPKLLLAHPLLLLRNLKTQGLWSH